MTNEDRRVSASKQVRHALRKEERQAAKVAERYDTTPRKAASPTTLRTPYGMRTIRPLIEDRMKAATVHMVDAADRLYFGIDAMAQGYEK